LPEICDFSLLPRASCGHCTSPEQPTNDPDIGRVFRARWDDVCREGCGFDIRAGALVRHVDGVLHHEGCTDA
jgi:hypothetical protein